jgi:hypothetical protein
MRVPEQAISVSSVDRDVEPQRIGVEAFRCGRNRGRRS